MPYLKRWMIIHLILTFSLLSSNTHSAEPLGTPDTDNIEYPEDEPPSQAEIELGKTLFFDTRLSVNYGQSCATCHNPELGFGDGAALGQGTMGSALARNTPHIYNLAWNSVFFWDGRASSLEEQALGPIEAAGEMNMPIDKLLPRLQAVPFYKEQFAQIYGGDKITAAQLGQAIAAFERSIVSDNSAFDQYTRGEKHAMSPAAIRGLNLFKGKANCIDCHNGPNFTDESFHNLGINDLDQGRAGIINEQTLLGAFKTPGLRNTLLTAPYMHDGSEATIEEVIVFYNNGGGKSPNKDPLMKPLNLTSSEINDLIAFMGALTDPVDISRPRIPQNTQMVSN